MTPLIVEGDGFVCPKRRNRFAICGRRRFALKGKQGLACIHCRSVCKMYLKEIQAGEGARNSITVVIVLRIYLREREMEIGWDLGA